MLRRYVAAVAAWVLWKCVENDSLYDEVEDDDDEPDITVDDNGRLYCRRDASPINMLSAILAANAVQETRDGFRCPPLVN
jgi:hypothetical protein